MSTDRYGRDITDHGDGTYSVNGISVAATDLSTALVVFDGMAPSDWVEPRPPHAPLEPVGALATLLAVVGVLSVHDAANAVGLLSEDLVAEAEAWAVAQASGTFGPY